MILTKENFQKLSNKNWRLNHLYKIVDKQKRLVVFKEKEVQRKFNNSAHTRNIILKSRQRGFTTNACIEGLDDVLFNKNFKFTIIADTLEHAEEIFEKIQIAWKHFPLRDFYQANTENTREISFNNGSTVKVTTDARSATVNRLHISELGKIAAKYPKKANDIITGSIPAVPKDGRVDIESTAEGEVGLFYELCQQFIDTKPQSPLDFKFHFFGWLDDDDCSLEGDIEVPADLREYQRKHQIPENKIKWYAQQRKILLDKIKQEYPTYAEEAFIYSGEKFFDSELIINLKKLAKEGKVEGSWIYYQNYIPGHYYGLGADVSEGIGKASNTIVIWDFTPDKPKVVAEYENKNIAPDLFAYEIKNGGEKYGMAVVAPERNNPGHATITELKKIYPEKNIYKYKITDRVNDLTTEKLGWETNLVTKPKMLYEFRRAVYDDLVEIPSRLILKEMGTYNTNDLLTTKRDEEMTEHWDRLVAAAIGFQMRNFIITKESSQATQYRPNLRRYNVRR